MRQRAFEQRAVCEVISEMLFDLVQRRDGIAVFLRHDPDCNKRRSHL
jgi:hypothetical protein